MQGSLLLQLLILLVVANGTAVVAKKLLGATLAPYAIAAAPCSSPERHLRLAKPYNFRPCGTTSNSASFGQDGG
jgi:hypothetical protein